MMELDVRKCYLVSAFLDSFLQHSIQTNLDHRKEIITDLKIAVSQQYEVCVELTLWMGVAQSSFSVLVALEKSGCFESCVEKGIHRFWKLQVRCIDGRHDLTAEKCIRHHLHFESSRVMYNFYR